MYCALSSSPNEAPSGILPFESICWRWCSEKRVDERSGGSTPQEDHHGKQQQNDDDGRQPPLLVGAQKQEKLAPKADIFSQRGKLREPGPSGLISHLARACHSPLYCLNLAS